ncbi:protein bric-a-brac 2 isoform X5 [Nasonia vitripennis]|nr:protein bric-a-brac 2 isoform X5 [Nasonia vitripennis]
MGSSQQFSLRWNNYLKHITNAFDTLRSDEDLVDVTLSCEGKRIRAHKMLLSACSTYFRDLFKENPCQHPVIIFRNVKFDDLAALVDFIYQGEVNVVQEQLDSFMTTAELLAVQGLTDGSRKDDSLAEDDVEIPSEPEVQLRNASGKVITNDKGNKSPSSPLPYHLAESHKSEAPPPNKRRRYRENSNAHSEKSNRHASSPKDSDKTDSQTVQEPVEIIPLMPNLKMEMPEYLEQDGSSCSYEEQSTGESSNKILDDNPDLLDNEQKPDITQTFYSNQSSTDHLDASKSSDIGYLLSKPGTSSGDRISHELLQEQPTHESSSAAAAAAAATAAAVATLGQQHEFQPPADVVGNSASSNGFEVVLRRRSRPLHDENGRWVCDVCGKIYNRGDSLAHHRSIHRGDTICPICQAVFTRKYTMRCHLVNVHGVKVKA